MSEPKQKIELSIATTEDEDLKLARDSSSTSPDTSLDSSRIGTAPRTRSASLRGIRLGQIEEMKPEEEEEQQHNGKRRGSLPDLKTEYKRRRKLPVGRILSPSHIDGFRKWALGDKFLDDLEMLQNRFESRRHNSTNLNQVIPEAEDDEAAFQDFNPKLVLPQDKGEDYSKKRSFTPDIQESIQEEAEELETKNIVKHDEFLMRLSSDVVDLPVSPRTLKSRRSWVESESIQEEDESQEYQFKHDEFIKRISTYETPMPTKEAFMQLTEVCEEEEEK